MDPIVVIGAGLAGYNVIKELRKLDADCPIQMICADTGEFYSKPLLSTGFAKEQSPDQLAMFSASDMAAKHNFDALTQVRITAIDTDNKQLISTTGKHRYSKLVLALGATPLPLSINGFQPLQINDLTDYRQFRQAAAKSKHITIIGAGLIGCEYAHDLISGGFQVQVVALSDYPLNLLVPEVVGRYIQAQLEQFGIQWHFGRKLSQIATQENRLHITLDNGETWQTDNVLSAIGLQANTALAKDAGLRTNNGIVTDQFLATSVPDIYALGDCASIQGHNLQYVLPLMASARALAKTLNGNATAVQLPAMPITVKIPSCPTCVCPPSAPELCQWQIDSDENGLSALAMQGEQLQGFALCGDRIAQRASLMKQLPPLI